MENKELTQEQREKLQNDAIKMALSRLENKDEVVCKLAAANTLLHESFSECLKDISAEEILLGHNKDHVFVAGIISQIIERVSLLCQ